MSQPLTIGAGQQVAGEPCIICGRSTTVRTTLPRPHFDLPQPTPERQGLVAAWLAKTPRHATFCYRHLHDTAPVALRLRDPRLLVQAGKELWFQFFDHPLHAPRMLWRPTRRTPIAATSAERQQKQWVSDRRRTRRRERRKILRRAMLIAKHRLRGVRLRGGT